MIRSRGVGLALAALALGASGAAQAQTPYEAQVMAALNMARTDPAGFAALLRVYRGYYRGHLITMPGEPVDIMTDEGVAAVDETIAFLGRQAPLAAVSPAATLAESAGDHVADQGPSGAIGHSGADGSSPSERAERRGGGPYIAEVIAYGSLDPLDVVRQLIVDDGVADRGHRSILYSADLRFAGVACGQHKAYRTMCTIDLGMTADGRVPSGMRLASGERASGRQVALR